MDKKRIAVDYEKASQEVLTAIKDKYPNGVEGNLIKFVKGDQTYYAINVETADTIYLVKIKRNVKTDDYDDDDYADSEFDDSAADDTPATDGDDEEESDSSSEPRDEYDDD